jgi:hypothetical protein
VDLKFRCEKCSRKLEASATLAGVTVSCPNCGADVTIPEAALLPGVTLAGFRIERELGRGAMGRVFLATQLSVDRQVALKVLPSPRVADSEYVERFFQEVRLAGRLDHPNIVAAFDAGEDHGYYYLAMAYIDGESLETRVKRAGPLPEREALTWCVSIAEALAYAWDHSHILHRDVKPANIMVDAEGRAIIMDMGIAKNPSDDSHLTATGVAVGTPYYMSPEQARGSQDLDARTDIYSMGATLFHLVTGRVPFPGTSAAEVVAKHLHDPVPSARGLKPELSRECEDIIVRMMAKDRSKRYGSWETCIHDLYALLKGKVPETTKAKVAKRASASLESQRAGASARQQATSSAWLLRTLLPVGLGALGAAVVIGALLVLRPPGWLLAHTARTQRPPRGAEAPAALPVAKSAVAAVEPAVPAAEPAGPAAEPAAPAEAPPAGQPPAPEAPDSGAAGQPGTKAAATQEPPVAAPAPVGGDTPPNAAATAAPDHLASALDRIAGVLLGGRPAAAVALWEQARPQLPASTTATQLADVTAALACVEGCERSVLATFRKNTATPITVRLKDRRCRVRIKAVVPPTVKTLEVLDNGYLGGSFSFADLDISEKLDRLGEPVTAPVALTRGLVAIWDQRLDLALPELRRFDAPLARAVLRTLDERAAAQLDQAADRDYADLLRGVLRATPPTDAPQVLQDVRQRLDTPRRLRRFEEQVKAYETAYKDSRTGAQHLLLLRRLLEYPFAGGPWTVPELGIEFVWVEPMGCWVGSYEVTNAQYRRFHGDHKPADASGLSLNDDSQPAVWVSFKDAEQFAVSLTAHEREAGRVPAGRCYRLPQAQEWTMLAGCGDDRKFPWGGTWPPPAEYNYNGSEWPGPDAARIPDHKDPFPVTCPVARSGRNSWGLYGVAGNAMEWATGTSGAPPELRGSAYCGSGESPPTPAAYAIPSAWAQKDPGYRSAASGFRLLLAGDPTPKPSAPAAK